MQGKSQLFEVDLDDMRDQPNVVIGPRCRRASAIRKDYLRCIKKNDVEGVRALYGADEESLGDPHAQDELGRTGLIIAIDKGNYDMIRCLLELQHDIGDALFHAVSIGSAQAVRTLCKNLPEARKLTNINSYPTGLQYPAIMTPLLLAGKYDDFEIIKILLEHGAKLPKLNHIIAQAEGDRYLQFLAKSCWYETACSEAYILLTSDDPLGTIFSLGEALQEAVHATDVHCFSNNCDRLQGRLADLSVKILSMARETNEISVLLQGVESDHSLMEPKVPLRIQQALQLDSFKKFVCHPSCQDYMYSQWQIPSHSMLTKYPRFIQSYVFNIAVMLLYPIFCLCYILLPLKQLHFVKAPRIRFLIHAGSRSTLLLLLICSTQSNILDILTTDLIGGINVADSQLGYVYILIWASPLKPLQLILVIWIIGMTVRSTKQVWSRGASTYISNRWNILDLLQLCLYWTCIISAIIARTQSLAFIATQDIYGRSSGPNSTLNSSVTSASSGGLLGNVSTSDEESLSWSDFQPHLLSDASFAIANVLSFLQILRHLIIFALLGPLLISFSGMIYDVLKFFLIFTFVLVSFSIGMTQIYHKFQALDIRDCTQRAVECPETPFLTFIQSMVTLFWSLFDIMDLSSLEIASDVGITAGLGKIMYASFMLIGTIVLLNALIAMMSNTYTRVEENSSIEWKVARTEIMAEYITECSSMPPPFNLVPSVKSVIQFIRYLRRKCWRPAREERRVKNQRKCMKQNGCSLYKEVSNTIGERCLRTVAIERVQSKGSNDAKAIRKSVDKLSCKVTEVEKQVNYIVDFLTNYRTTDARGCSVLQMGSNYCSLEELNNS